MTNFALKDRAAIAGVGQSQYGRRLMRSPIDLAADAIASALDDCGLPRDQLDGMIVSFGSPIGADADTIAQLLGLKLRTYNQTWAHGRFTASAIIWAAMMVNAGMADAVACLASVSFSAMRRPMMGGAGDREGGREAGGGHGEDPVYGMTSPGSGAALVARKYFDRYGTDSRALASIPVAFRKHASMNPAAIMREPFSVEDHQRSRYVCEPLHLLDYCLINDGAACVIVTTSERARDLNKRPVYISGMQGLPGGREEFIWAYPGLGVLQQSIFEYEAGLQPVYKMAGVTQKDIDALFTYDAFSIVAWIALERFGFCKPGEAAAFTQDGRIEIGGELPMNTNGGLLSEAHIMGWNHQVEIVRQLRGECGPRQVPDATIIQWANAYGDSLIYRR
ncbi:MAG TPA: thiolase family protein [Candidatus Binataceae bacterium]|nr:thiolase family protein [Candidatus Binataceae bacterium]